MRLGSDYQSAIHKFLSTQKVVSFDSTLSCKTQEFLSLKSKHSKLLTTFKIADHEDRVKQKKELTFDKRINIMCDYEAKELTCKQIRIQGASLFSFMFHSPRILNKCWQTLSSAALTQDEVCS